MMAKEYLQQAENMNTVINNKMAEKAQWKDIALGVTSGGQSIMIEVKGKKELHNMEKVQSSGSQSKMADAITRCIDIEAEIDRLVDRLIDLKREIIGTIEMLNATEYDVLHKRYIQGMTFDEIGAARNKSKSWATTVHGRALQNVQKILDAREQEKAERMVELLERYMNL